MANIKSAEKRIRTSERNRQRNRRYRTQIKTAVAKFEENLDQESFQNAASILDRAARKGVIHKNQASRKKSRMAAKLNQS